MCKHDFDGFGRTWNVRVESVGRCVCGSGVLFRGIFLWSSCLGACVTIEHKVTPGKYSVGSFGCVVILSQIDH